MICKSAVYDAYRILLMVILLITTYSKKQSNEKKPSEMPGIKNFLGDLQMADQCNRWAICLKHISLNIRNVVHPIYEGFHGERGLNRITIECKHLSSFLLCFRICSRSFALCYKLCSKQNPKALSWKCFEYCWTCLKMLITKPKFSKMGMYRSMHIFACMKFMPSNYSKYFLKNAALVSTDILLMFCVNLGGLVFFSYGRQH